MPTITTIPRKGGQESYMVTFVSPETSKPTTRTFRDRSQAEAFADERGGWGRGKTGPVPRPVVERLAARAIVGGPDECWLWQGATNGTNDYGTLGIRGRTLYAHRVAWEEANGRPVPAGLVVRHSCDNPPCINPAHLDVGTQQDNVDDMMARTGSYMAKRTHCKHGHEYTPENTRINSRGTRDCRTCERARVRRRDVAP